MPKTYPEPSSRRCGNWSSAVSSIQWEIFTWDKATRQQDSTVPARCKMVRKALLTSRILVCKTLLLCKIRVHRTPVLCKVAANSTTPVPCKCPASTRFLANTKAPHTKTQWGRARPFPAQTMAAARPPFRPKECRRIRFRPKAPRQKWSEAGTNRTIRALSSTISRPLTSQTCTIFF